MVGIIVGLIVGWGGTTLMVNRGAEEKCLVDETAEDCAERLAESMKQEEGEEGDGIVNDDTSEADSVKENVGETSGNNVPVSQGKVVFDLASNNVSVDNQKAGSVVAVTNVTLSQLAWIVVHEDANGAPGWTLGARRYDAGIHLGEVELVKPTVSGKTYQVVIHADDGDKQFDLKKDLPVVDASGKYIMDSFVAE